MLVLSLFLLTRLFILYGEYKEFKEKPFFYTDVQVVQAYEKWKDDEYYTILKLYSATLDINFFSRTKIRAEDISSQIRVKLFPHDDMKFSDYLGTSFIFSKINEIYEPKEDMKNELFEAVDRQHDNVMIANFYEAIFFATPLEKDLRTQVATLGVSHLIALSGFIWQYFQHFSFFYFVFFIDPCNRSFFLIVLIYLILVLSS